MTDWLVVHTRPSLESHAVFFLERLSNVYFPKIRRQLRRNRRRFEVTRPLFPRYLMVENNEQPALINQVRHCPGVSDLVWVGDRVAQLPDTVVTELRRREVDGYIPLDDAAPVGFHTDARIRVVCGPMQGLNGVFRHAVDDERALVFLRILGRLARTTIRLDELSL